MTITMTAPVGPNRLDKPGLVGQPMDRVDGRAKVTGRATYAYEVRDQDAAAAYGYIVQSAIAKGRIAGIDTRAAERAPGVIAVLTHQNAPQQDTGDHRLAWPQLNDDQGAALRPTGRPGGGRDVRAGPGRRLPRPGALRPAAGRLRIVAQHRQGACAGAREQPARQRRRRLCRRVRVRAGKARRELHDPAAKPRDDGAACDAGCLERGFVDPVHLQPDAEPGAAERRAHAQDAAGESASGQPLYRRWLWRQAVGDGRRRAGGDRGAEDRPPGEGGPDPPADLPRRDPPVGHDPARAAGRRPGRPADRHRARRALGQSGNRAVL